MAEAENKDDPLKLQEGQRILSKIEALCHKFRQTVGAIVKQVKQDEYDIAIREVTEAQRKIDKRRMDELSRLAETQSRPLTALEKVRLQHLQKMEESEKKESELLTTPFTSLLDRELGGSAVSGLDVETVLEDLMSPFVTGVLLEVENLYAVNQSILHLAARCRSEAVHFQKRVKDLKAEVETLKREARENEDKIVRLQLAVRERTDQLEGIRAAHFKEVIAVKEQTIENLKDKTANVEEVLLRGGRGFDPYLLNSLGSDANGRDLDKALKDFIDGQTSKPNFPPRDGGATPGGAGDGPAVVVSENSKDGFDYPLKLMRIENELTQTRFQVTSVVLLNHVRN
mmetsp:Transcript_61702/g.145098  ORF Transcript_61702/g.145098 Transcript_61702/m.145098 type:complete len:342 (+) Transcript_61702:113-1138(+)